jgi:hypothetical protein
MAYSWLARKLTVQGIGYTMADNAFVRIDAWERAQQQADALSPDQLHRTLDRYAALCCPVSEVFGQSYHWSLMQVEYATDLAFRSTTTLGPLSAEAGRLYGAIFRCGADSAHHFRVRHPALLPPCRSAGPWYRAARTQCSSDGHSIRSGPWRWHRCCSSS